MSLHETAKQLIYKSVEENDILIVTSDRQEKSFVNEILLHDVFRKDKNVNLEVLNIDKYRDEDAAVIHRELAKLTRQPYFPYVWVNGTYLGGESQTKRAMRNGDLEYYLDR